MFGILGLLAMPQTVSASTTIDEWKTTTRATVVINEMNFANPGTLLRTIEIWSC
jgi:hypothetical protein